MRATEVPLGHLALPVAPPVSLPVSLPELAAGSATHPGVVLIPDVRGVYDHFRELAGRLAAEGFAVLVLDLYRREGPPRIADAAAALRWIRELSDPSVLADVQEARDFLAAHPAVAGRPVGVIGFCMGGQYALLAACGCRGLGACVSFYGMLRYEAGLDPAKKPRSPLQAIPDLRCPVLGLYGEEDGLIPVSDVRALEKALALGTQPHEVRLYPGAGHAFVNDSRPEAYRPEAARDAWQRMLDFLRRHLGAVAP